MNLDSLRQHIDQIDLEMMILFKKRMDISFQIGQYKKQNHLSILDSNREKEILLLRKKQLNQDALWPLYEQFIIEVMRLSKENQK